jgi:hypothetical protein
MFVYYYSAIAETLDVAGGWTFWPHIVDANGQIYPGEAIFYNIFRPGQ